MQPLDADTSDVSPRDAAWAALWPEGGPQPTKTIACRHCGRKNRVRVADAIRSLERHACGACHKALFLRHDEPLARLSAEAYEHPLDRTSMAALRSIPGLPDAVRWVLQHYGDRTTRLVLMSNAVACSPKQAPELVELMELARSRLDLTVRPALFVGQSPFYGAMSTGVEDPAILLHSALVDPLTSDELVAVLGHELGHLHASHQLYRQLALLLLVGGSAVSSVARLFGWPLRLALLKWQRCAELTADRAAALATRDLGVCIRLMLRFASGLGSGSNPRRAVDLGAFIAQCRDLARLESSGWVDEALLGWITMESSHPVLAWRVMHLVLWAERGQYLDILAGRYDRRDERAF